jgi:hypothetical protein
LTPGLKLFSGIGRFLLFLGLLPIAFANEFSSTIDVPYVAVNVNIPMVCKFVKSNFLA